MKEITSTDTVTGPKKTHFRQANSDVTQRFVHDIEAGFNRYKQKYAVTGYSRRRGKDVSDLRNILYDMPHETLLHCIDVLRQRTQAIQTGFFIFQTGRSKLKKYTLKTLDNYSDPAIGTELEKIARNSETKFMSLTDAIATEAIAIARQKDGPDRPDSHSKNYSTELIEMRLAYLESEHKRRKQETTPCWKPRLSFFAADEASDNSYTNNSHTDNSWDDSWTDGNCGYKDNSPEKEEKTPVYVNPHIFKFR